METSSGSTQASPRNPDVIPAESLASLGFDFSSDVDPILALKTDHQTFLTTADITAGANHHLLSDYNYALITGTATFEIDDSTTGTIDMTNGHGLGLTSLTEDGSEIQFDTITVDKYETNYPLNVLYTPTRAGSVMGPASSLGPITTAHVTATGNAYLSMSTLPRQPVNMVSD